MNIQLEGKSGSQFRDEDLQSLREWLKKQPHLPEVSGIKYYFICTYTI